MSALEGMSKGDICQRNMFQCQIREFLYLYQHKKSTYKICRDLYVQSISISHSFIILKILSIIKVSTEMGLEKQTVGGQEKGRAGHSTAFPRITFSSSLHTQAQRGTANRSAIVWINWPNNTSGVKRWGSGRATKHWRHYIAKADLFGRKGDMSLSISYTFPCI